MPILGWKGRMRIAAVAAGAVEVPEERVRRSRARLVFGEPPNVKRELDGARSWKASLTSQDK